MSTQAMELWADAARRTTRQGRSRRFTPEMRAAGTRLASAALASGLKKSEVSRRLGISEPTLNAWVGDRSFLEVEVVRDPIPPIRLFLGRGHADLTAEQLSHLLWGSR